VADRIAILQLGRMVAEGPATEFDRQRVVEYMTTGKLDGKSRSTAGVAAAETA
jgi:ABC-type sugar transport system ATPase subunit